MISIGKDAGDSKLITPQEDNMPRPATIKESARMGSRDSATHDASKEASKPGNKGERPVDRFEQKSDVAIKQQDSKADSKQGGAQVSASQQKQAQSWRDRSSQDNDDDDDIGSERD